MIKFIGCKFNAHPAVEMPEKSALGHSAAQAANRSAIAHVGQLQRGRIVAYHSYGFGNRFF